MVVSFLPLIIKVRVAKLVCHPAIGRLIAWIFADHLPSRGLRIDTATSLITPEVKASLFWGLYESAEIRFAEKYLRTDLDVIELGSSLGVLSCCIRRKLGASCRLICVEANPDLTRLASHNLSANGLSERVFIEQKAVSYLGGDEVHFFHGQDNTTGVTGSDGMPMHGETIVVPATTLARIAQAYALKEYALVSDIEGAEIGIILNEKDGLRNCKQLIAELHSGLLPSGDRISVNDLCDMLIRHHGFVLCDRHGAVCVFDKQ